MKAIGAVPSPKREYNSRVIPVAFFIAGSITGFAFFFFWTGTELEMERTSRMSALVMLECFQVLVMWILASEAENYLVAIKINYFKT